MMIYTLHIYIYIYVAFVDTLTVEAGKHNATAVSTAQYRLLYCIRASIRNYFSFKIHHTSSQIVCIVD